MLGDPGRWSKVWQALDRAISESGKNRSQIVAHWEFQSTAAFHHRKNRCDLRSRLRAADVDPVLSAESYGAHRVLRQVITQLQFGCRAVLKSRTGRGLLSMVSGQLVQKRLD